MPHGVNPWHPKEIHHERPHSLTPPHRARRRYERLTLFRQLRREWRERKRNPPSSGFYASRMSRLHGRCQSHYGQPRNLNRHRNYDGQRWRHIGRWLEGRCCRFALQFHLWAKPRNPEDWPGNWDQIGRNLSGRILAPLSAV